MESEKEYEMISKDHSKLHQHSSRKHINTYSLFSLVHA